MAQSLAYVTYRMFIKNCAFSKIFQNIFYTLGPSVFELRWEFIKENKKKNNNGQEKKKVSTNSTKKKKKTPCRPRKKGKFKYLTFFLS